MTPLDVRKFESLFQLADDAVIFLAPQDSPQSGPS
jgi:hypothetical protein